VEVLRKNYPLIGLSNKKSFQLSISKNNLKQIKYDINKIKIKQIPDDVFSIIHLAALTDIQYCEQNPKICFDVNVHGTKKMLEMARKKDLKFLFVSSSHVFGKPKKNPIDENQPKNPHSIYSLSKLIGENLCESYAQLYGLDVSIIRFFSIYGPNSPSHLVTSKIISQLLTENKIRLGNIFSKRDFLYIQDAVKAIEIVFKKNRGFNSYNVGFGKSYSISEVCKILMKVANKDIKIESQKSIQRSDDVKEILANNSKIKKLGWKPNFGIEKGLKLTYDWFRSKL